jgi:cation-transporting P-type ATPase D
VKNYCDLKVLAQRESDSGLIALWKKYCGFEFPRENKKRLQKSDWFQRPLTEEQLNYAALDCRYLVSLRGILL